MSLHLYRSPYYVPACLCTLLPTCTCAYVQYEYLLPTFVFNPDDAGELREGVVEEVEEGPADDVRRVLVCPSVMVVWCCL